MSLAAQAQHDEWDDWLLAQTDRQCPLAAKTVEVYRQGARQFVDWLIEHEPTATGPGAVTSRHGERPPARQHAAAALE